MNERSFEAVADPESCYRPVRAILRGVDHLALVTSDMAATVEFYTTVMGLPLVHVRRVPYAEDRGQPPYDNVRHYFFDMGGDNLLAFFEYPTDAPRGGRDSLGSMQHLAFHADRDDFDAMRSRLLDCGIEYVGPVFLGGRFTSIYFYDPNDIRLEVTTDVDRKRYETVASVYQSVEEARAELSTLYDDPATTEALLARMPHTGEGIG
jgi:catechol 2,3-dioxygenase-like lactoylglutathione lyase family enzyme